MGEIYALGAAACWTGTSILFSKASREMGSVTVNRMRLVLGLLAVALVNWLRLGRLWPAIPLTATLWLLLSGLIGFALGDAMLYEAYVHIGASQAMLLQTLSPIFSALIGWLFLHELLSLWQILAVSITLAGIAMVIVNSSAQNGRHSRSWLGIGMGIGAALGQAVGLLFSKRGLQCGVEAFQANQVRLLAGAGAIVVWGLLHGQLRKDLEKVNAARSWGLLATGVAFGPVLGVLFSLLAVRDTHMALAATLMGLTPVMMLPVMHFAFGERYRWPAVCGTLTAVCGAALLLWV